MTIGEFVCCLIGCGILFGVYSCTVEANSPAGQARAAAYKKKCETPVLVSEIDGLKLYSVEPDCGRKVYFSAAGTSTTHTEGRTMGKVHETVTVDDVVPNGGEQ